MKDGDDPFLQGKPEVDQYVAATDKVDARKWRILKKVLPGEDTTIADRFNDPIAAFHLGEKTLQPLRRDIGRNTFGVDPSPGFVNARLAEIRAKELDRNSFPIAQELNQRNGVRVGFFAC